jgi:PTS system ascorbate-specific IIA component
MTGLILLTYGGTGHELLDAASHIFNEPFDSVALVEVTDAPCTADTLPGQLQMALASNPGQPALILTDLPGCTHFNIAASFVAAGRVALIGGLNLPMLLRVLSHRDSPLHELVEYAHEGGRQGIITVLDKAESNDKP